MPDTADHLIRRLDGLVDEYCTRFFNEPISMGRVRTWVMQHRLNTRQRNSALKSAWRQIAQTGMRAFSSSVRAPTKSLPTKNTATQSRGGSI